MSTNTLALQSCKACRAQFPTSKQFCPVCGAPSPSSMLSSRQHAAARPSARLTSAESYSVQAVQSVQVPGTSGWLSWQLVLILMIVTFGLAGFAAAAWQSHWVGRWNNQRNLGRSVLTAFGFLAAGVVSFGFGALFGSGMLVLAAVAFHLIAGVSAVLWNIRMSIAIRSAAEVAGASFQPIGPYVILFGPIYIQYCIQALENEMGLTRP